MFCAKFVSCDVQIEVLIDNLLIGLIRSNYINFHEIMCSYEPKNVKNHKQLV
jgi:hypothetical protein